MSKATSTGIEAIRDALSVELNTALARHGFSLMGRQRLTFARRSRHGQDRLVVTVGRLHGGWFSVHVSVQLRNDNVEEIANALLNSKENSKANASMSTGAELGHLACGRFQMWTLKKTEDVVQVADEIVATIAGHALPFFEDNGTLKPLLTNLLSRLEQEPMVVAVRLGARAIAAAKLLGWDEQRISRIGERITSRVVEGPEGGNRAQAEVELANLRKNLLTRN